MLEITEYIYKNTFLKYSILFCLRAWPDEEGREGKQVKYKKKSKIEEYTEGA